MRTRQPAGVMPFWHHVQELRIRLLVTVTAFIALAVAAYMFYPVLFKFLQQVVDESLFVFTITDAFTIRIQVALYSALIASIPMILIQATLFIFPALQGTERGLFIGLVIAAFLLFVAGVLFSWKLVIPMSVEFLKRPWFYPGEITRMIGYRKWIGFLFRFLIGFGLCFEFPVVLLFLLKTGLVKQSFLWKNFKFFIIGWFVVAAIITPPDIVSQLALALPMNILYLLCLLVARILRLGMDDPEPAKEDG
jgi:sec-independent protein translocase protein TatC